MGGGHADLSSIPLTKHPATYSYSLQRMGASPVEVKRPEKSLMMPGIKPGDLYKGTTTSVWHARSLLAAVGRVGKTSDGKSETVMGLSRGAWVRFPASAHPPKQEFFSFGPSACLRHNLGFRVVGRGGP